MCAEGSKGHLLTNIAAHIHHWILFPDIQLQTLAVKIVSNLSERTAVAEAGMLKSVIRKYHFFAIFFITGGCSCTALC